MKKILALALIGVALASCDDDTVKKVKEPSPVIKVDQKLRNDIFMACLKAVPAGPQQTKYNDWDEVVGKCDNAAYYQSKYCAANCDSGFGSELPERKG